MERIEKFADDRGDFLVIDFSGIKSDEGFLDVIRSAKPLVAASPLNSLYTAANVENIRYDSKTKLIIMDFIEHNKPYVKCAAIFGMDGIKKLVIKTLMKLCGRKNVLFTFTKEKAIELLRQQN